MEKEQQQSVYQKIFTSKLNFIKQQGQIILDLQDTGIQNLVEEFQNKQVYAYVSNGENVSIQEVREYRNQFMGTDRRQQLQFSVVQRNQDGQISYEIHGDLRNFMSSLSEKLKIVGDYFTINTGDINQQQEDRKRRSENRGDRKNNSENINNISISEKVDFGKVYESGLNIVKIGKAITIDVSDQNVPLIGDVRDPHITLIFRRKGFKQEDVESVQNYANEYLNKAGKEKLSWKMEKMWGKRSALIEGEIIQFVQNARKQFQDMSEDERLPHIRIVQ